MVGRYKDAIEVQKRQSEENWNADAFVVIAGSLAELGKADEAKELVTRGITKYPKLLTIEKFALNRGWPPDTVPVMTDLMRKAGYPACAAEGDLADSPNPVRLPECVKA
jgi:hypothetical protein